MLLTSFALAADLAITNVTLLVVSGPSIPNGTLVVHDGRIAALGTKIAIPSGAEVVDGTGKYLMPGIIDVHSHMGVYAWPGGNAHSDGNEMVEPFTPRAWAGDAFDMEDPAIPRARAGGVTSVQVLPGSGNLIGGRSLTIKLRPSRTLNGMAFEGAPPGIKMAIGENPKRVYQSELKQDDQIMTRMGEYAAFRAEFQAALDYRSARARANPPPRDLDLEVILDVIDDKLRVNLHCYRTHDILAFYRIADDFGFKVWALHHALEAYKIRDVIAAHGSMVATFADWWGFKLEAWDAIPQNAVLTSQAGIPSVIKSDSASHIQRLNLEAAKMVRYGMTELDALESITLDAARVLGTEARVGSLEVGKDADLALFDHHPFDAYTKCEKTWIDGALVYDRATMGVPDGLR